MNKILDPTKESVYKLKDILTMFIQTKSRGKRKTGNTRKQNKTKIKPIIVSKGRGK